MQKSNIKFAERQVTECIAMALLSTGMSKYQWKTEVADWTKAQPIF